MKEDIICWASNFIIFIYIYYISSSILDTSRPSKIFTDLQKPSFNLKANLQALTCSNLEAKFLMLVIVWNSNRSSLMVASHVGEGVPKCLGEEFPPVIWCKRMALRASCPKTSEKHHHLHPPGTMIEESLKRYQTWCRAGGECQRFLNRFCSWCGSILKCGRYSNLNRKMIMNHYSSGILLSNKSICVGHYLRPSNVQQFNICTCGSRVKRCT